MTEELKKIDDWKLTDSSERVKTESMYCASKVFLKELRSYNMVTEIQMKNNTNPLEKIFPY